MDDDDAFAFAFTLAGDRGPLASMPEADRPRTSRPFTSTGLAPRTFGADSRPRTSFGTGGQQFSTVTEGYDDESDEEDSPFAFAPPPLAPSSPPSDAPTPSSPSNDLIGRRDDHDAPFSAPPASGELDHPNGVLSPAVIAFGLPAFVPSHADHHYSRPSQGGRAAAAAEISHPNHQSVLSPAASFAQKVQTGAPDWIEDDGFSRDVVEASTRDTARRPPKDRPFNRRAERRGVVLGQPTLREPASVFPVADDKDTVADSQQTSIPLAEFAHTLPVHEASDEDKDDFAAGIEPPSRPRRRRRFEPKPKVEDLEDSPYPAVQGSVSNIDDHDAVVVTFRTWVMGFFFCIVFAAVNSFFSLRYPAPIITPIVTQLIAYPVGKYIAKVTPSWKLRFLPQLQKLGLPVHLSLNPGPFSIKEHTLLTIMVNISTQPALGLSYSLAAEKGYGRHQPAGFDLLFILTSQIIGFGAAGLCRRFLVWPAAMIWPQNLVFSTVLNTLHAELDDEEPGVSRFRFFVYVIIGAFCWYWLPGFLFTALSAFSWICWMAPNNVVVNQLFGVASGLGMGILTFDWGQITYCIPPLVIPWWAQVNLFVGFAISMWIVAPVLYYSNVWDFAYLPISTTSVFDRYAEPYNTSRVIDATGMRFNVTAYREYSPIYLPAALTTSYGLQFMLAVAVLVHTILYHGSELWRRLVTPHSFAGNDDVHMRLMRKYREVPDWWYAGMLLVAIGVSLATVAAWDTSMPPWALLVAIVLGIVYFLPSGIIFALTGLSPSLNLLIELVAGYMMPGLPLANMLFKIYSLQLVNLGLYYAQDLKLAHYQKIPPRVTFVAQLAATVVTAFAQVGIKRWLVAAVPTLCEPDQSARLTCPYAQTTYSTSAIWGVIGPARLFSAGQRYQPLLYGLLFGAGLPSATWILARRFPRSWVVYINIPVMLIASLSIPPGSGINFSSPLIVGFIFQYLVRHRNFEWWSKYNFLLSAGLDAGTVLSGILIFLALQLPKDGNITLNWWGNDVYTKTADWLGTPYKTPPPEGFGPTSW